MRNKKFITLLLAAIVAITSVAPGIQVKAEELFSFNVVLDGSGNYTVATGSSVATATPVPTETVEQTASPFVTAAPKRTGKIWYRYNNVRYCYDKELEKFVLECEKCEKTITAYSACRYKIQKHIKNCKGKKISRSVSARLANYGEDVIASNMVPGTEPSYKKWSDLKCSKLSFTNDDCTLLNLPKSVKAGTKVTFQLKGQKKYVTKLKWDKKYKVNYVEFDYAKNNTGLILTEAFFEKKYKGKCNWYKGTFDFKTYKKYKKFSKKYGLWSGEVTFKGREELTVSIEGYGTYVLNVSEYSPGGIGLNCTTYLYLKWK